MSNNLWQGKRIIKNKSSIKFGNGKTQFKDVVEVQQYCKKNKKCYMISNKNGNSFYVRSNGDVLDMRWIRVVKIWIECGRYTNSIWDMVKVTYMGHLHNAK